MYMFYSMTYIFVSRQRRFAPIYVICMQPMQKFLCSSLHRKYTTISAYLGGFWHKKISSVRERTGPSVSTQPN